MTPEQFTERVKTVGLIRAVYDLVETLTELSDAVVDVGDTVLEVGRTVAAVVPVVNEVKGRVAAVEPVVPVVSNIEAMMKPGGKVGFLGKTPVVQQKVTVAPSGTKAATVKIGNVTVLTGATSTLIDNNVERLNQIEAALKAYGLL